MLGIVIIWLRNAVRSIRNGWRRLWRLRVDYVQIELSGHLPEFAPAQRWWQRRLMPGRESEHLQGLRRKFEQICSDPNTRGVLLRINGLEAGWATLQSLRDELALVRRSGKRVVAYVLTPDTAGYYVACAADEIILPPTAMLLLIGLRSEVQFLKPALDKVGIEFEVEAVSPYKAAGEQFVRSDMSPENREQLERLLDARFNALVGAISASRELSAEQVRAVIDRAPLGAQAALEAGLVDALCYEDELAERLKVGTEAPIIQEWDDAKGALRLQPLTFQRKMVGVVTVEGTIAMGTSRSLPVPIPQVGGQQAGADSVIQALRQAEQHPRVAAVVLYVNSPGGDAFASDLIWREVLRLGKKKPVVVAMGDAAASGGYYIAAPAQSIVAQPGTLTGSIGVVMMRPIVEGLLERIGVNTVVLSRGAHSGLLSIAHAPNDDERQALRNLIARSYEEFKQRVRDGRKLSDEQLEPMAGGRVWMGEEALQLGLVDQLGGVPEAVLRAQELAKLPLNRNARLLLLRGKDETLQPLPFSTSEPSTLLSMLERSLRPRVWAILPFDVV
jgi:protease-4